MLRTLRGIVLGFALLALFPAYASAADPTPTPPPTPPATPTPPPTLIKRSLERTQGNKVQAARLLNLKRTTLIEKLKRLERGQPGVA